jgi:hypothetical protein
MNLSIKIKILVFILISQAFAMASNQVSFPLIASAYADEGGDSDGDDGDSDGGHGDDGDDGDDGGHDDGGSDDGGGDSDSGDSGGDSSSDSGGSGGDSSDIDDFLEYYNEIDELSGLMQMQAKKRTVLMDEERGLINQNWLMNSIANQQDISVAINSAPVKSLYEITVSDPLMDIKYPLIKSDTSNDIAVIIANENYEKSIDIPNNDPATRDAKAFRLFARDGLGILEGNIIWINNGTQANFLRVFGSETNHKGQLFDWVKKDKSRVYVYYAGHGAPSRDKDSFLIPADSDSSRLDLNGYRLSTLYNNLSKIPTKETLVVLESCFSGISQNGETVKNASPIYARTSSITPPTGISVISATHANQVASWEPDASHGLFTKFFLKAMSGEADVSPYGDNNGTVDFLELDNYLKDTLTYWARRHYGRDQVAEIFKGK